MVFAMAETKKRRQLETFPGLSADRFQHPQDQAATQTLAGIPGLDLLISKVMEYLAVIINSLPRSGKRVMRASGNFGRCKR
jgi:hypothetical protein